MEAGGNVAEHPITPPEATVLSLRNSAPHGIGDAGVTRELWLINHAYAAGADQELEACCEWTQYCEECGDSLRAARRPKPPSLKEQVLGALSRADKDALTNPLTGEVVALRTILNKEQSDTIRRALEQLDD